MKTKAKKLSVNRETLRSLDEAQLSGAQGGSGALCVGTGAGPGKCTANYSGCGIPPVVGSATC